MIICGVIKCEKPMFAKYSMPSKILDVCWECYERITRCMPSMSPMKIRELKAKKMADKQWVQQNLERERRYESYQASNS